jgi:hypothetical protein
MWYYDNNNNNAIIWEKLSIFCEYVLTSCFTEWDWHPITSVVRAIVDWLYCDINNAFQWKKGKVIEAKEIQWKCLKLKIEISPIFISDEKISFEHPRLLLLEKSP